MALAEFTLRVNVLEQCQLDCGYCRPGTATVTRSADRLQPEHYARLAQALGGLQPLAVRKIRFTGGEPLLRADLPEIISAFHAHLPHVPLALTTNGVHLARHLDRLHVAGLSGATVHVDSLRQDRYAALMGGHARVDAVLASVEEAKHTLRSVKLNVVVQRGLNDDEVGDFLDWSAVTGVQVRFIELMNTGAARDFTGRHFVSRGELLRALERHGPVTTLPRAHPADPASLHEVGGVTFGIISSDSSPFCDDCDRLRLSPAGLLRGCMYARGGAPVGALLRESATLAEVRGLLRLALSQKQSHHPARGLERASFSMAQVGG